MQLASGLRITESKTRPLLAGKEKDNGLQKTKEQRSLIDVCCPVINTSKNEMDNFWRFELIGITDDPQLQLRDDEVALEKFQRSVNSRKVDVSLAGFGRKRMLCSVPTTDKYWTLEFSNEYTENATGDY